MRRLLTALLLPLALPAAAAEPEDGGLLVPPSSLFTPGPALAPTPMSQALPADQAFAFQTLVELPGTLVLMWEIQEGYYLYRKSLEFSESGAEKVLGEPLIPQGVMVTDEFFGESEVYHDRLLVRIPFETGTAGEIELSVTYQGCAEIGYCYPEQRKTVKVELPR